MEFEMTVANLGTIVRMEVCLNLIYLLYLLTRSLNAGNSYSYNNYLQELGTLNGRNELKIII